MKQTSLVLILCYGLTGVLGCSTAHISPLTVKNIANAFEDPAQQIPLLSPYSTMTNSASQIIRWAIADRKPERVGITINNLLALDASGQEQGFGLTLYRQYPHGILNRINGNDLCISVVAADNSFDHGEMLVFFTPDCRYKGYFAYSRRKYSRDTSERMLEEMKAYKELGCDVKARNALQKLGSQSDK